MRAVVVGCRWLSVFVFFLWSLIPLNLSLAADYLEFCVTFSSWTPAEGLTRLSSGAIDISTTGGDFSAAAVDTAGHLTFRVPSEQAATWAIDAGEIGLRNLRSEIIDGLLYIYDTDNDDTPVPYTANSDGTYCIEYYSDYLYICGPAEANSPIMGRTYQPQYDIAQKRAGAKNMLAKLPLYFEENQGQVTKEYDFLARVQGMKILIGPNRATFSMRGSIREGHPKDRYQTRHNILMKIRHGDGTAKAVGNKKQPGKVNYLVGKKENWKTDIPTFGQVRYEQVYPGIDLVYYGQGKTLEYDFIVAPGVDPAQITLSFEGHSGLGLDRDGNLVLGSGLGRVVKKKPFIYQEANGKRKQVEGSYRLLAKNTVGFKLGEYDEAKPLIIDPQLLYSTYLGGSGGEEGMDIAVDSSGAVYITGWTASNDFPTTSGAFDESPNTSMDVFITKLNPSGSGLVYSTYVGGGNVDFGIGLDLDSSGAAYVTGYTRSIDFPATAGAYEPNHGGGIDDAFMTKLNPAGSGLDYSTYLGGGGDEQGLDIAVDSSGAAYVTGFTDSNPFPTTVGAYDEGFNGGLFDTFVTKLDPAGNGAADLVYSTYLGGGGNDYGYGIVLDSSNAAYVTGGTASNPFPTTAGAYDVSYNNSTDAFVTKLNPAGSGLEYSTYLGGGGVDNGRDLVLDSSGSVYLTGITGSNPFPTTAGAYDESLNGGSDAFVTKLDPAGNGAADLVYSTYLGGSSSDEVHGICVDSSGAAYVTGETQSIDFPLKDELDATNDGVVWDAFVTGINPAGEALIYSSYLGGVVNEKGQDVVVDSSGGIYVGGTTGSNDFSVTPGAFDTTHGGSGDAFVTKIGDPAAAGNGGLPPGGPYGQWGGGREIQLTGFCGDISDLIAQCLAAGGDCVLSFAWPFSFGSDPTTTETGEGGLEPQNSAMPFFMLSWVYPDGTIEEHRLAVGESATLPSGAVCTSSLGQDVGVQHVALKQTLPGSLVGSLETGTHTLTYWLMDTDGNNSNKRVQLLTVE